MMNLPVGSKQRGGWEITCSHILYLKQIRFYFMPQHNNIEHIITCKIVTSNTSASSSTSSRQEGNIGIHLELCVNVQSNMHSLIYLSLTCSPAIPEEGGQGGWWGIQKVLPDWAEPRTLGDSKGLQIKHGEVPDRVPFQQTKCNAVPLKLCSHVPLNGKKQFQSHNETVLICRTCNCFTINAWREKKPRTHQKSTVHGAFYSFSSFSYSFPSVC